ncbi:condensation domain-containing protein, partial [Acetobacter persici]|uniref:condensation domain-containing protein n=1 Tax=Acetobacter persici TaxID=1076596 RepID=UPI0036D792F7
GVAYVAPRTQTEAALLDVFRTVLGRDDIGIHDNFFSAGGDSIMALRVVSLARETGLSLAVRQVFDHPDIAALAALAGRAGQEVVREELHTPLALTPIQGWFFEDHPWAPAHWNQSVLLKAPASLLSADIMRAALAAVIARHDALRLRFVQDDEGVWQQQVRPVEAHDVLQITDLSDAGENWRDALRTAGERIQTSLDLEDGPIIRAGWFRLPDASVRLLIAIHHLSVDGVSWRVLLADLQKAVEQQLAGEAPVLPDAVTPWSAWVRALSNYAREEKVRSELGWWEDYLAGTTGKLPVNDAGDRSLSQTRTVRWKLDEPATRRLLDAAPRAYRMGVEEVLLAGLGRTLGTWAGQESVLVGLEGHGREDVLEGMDLSSTVGWFTTRYTAVIPGIGADDRQALIGAKESVRSIPHKGFGLGLLTQLGDGETRSRARALPQPSVSFNYLGQFDQTLRADGPLGFAGENAGASAEQRGTLKHVLDLNGMVAGGCLSFTWRYSPDVVATEVVEDLAERFGAELERLVQHCACAPLERTASDVPLSGLTQKDLERLELTGDDVEDVYAATALQQGLLFHSQMDVGSYVNQHVLTLRGHLDRVALRGAWNHALARHAILRTRFADRHGGVPQQVVMRHADLPWSEHDWSGLGDAAYAEQFARWMADDRRQGFDPLVAPLLRIDLFDRPDGAVDFVWTDHHALLDGWGSAELLGQVMSDYQARVANRPAALPEVTPYRNYVAWLQRQGDALEWWREQVARRHEPATLTASLPAPERPETGTFAHRLALGEEASTHIRMAARHHGVTVNTVMQGAWALLLARYGNASQVTFGVTMSGRPAGLPGIDRMLGLFINSLPLWVDVPASMDVGAWLRNLQRLNADLREHEYSALSDVQRLAGVRGDALFDSLIVFENYPVDTKLRERDTGTDLAVVAGEGVEQTHYPLSVAINDSDQITVQFRRDGRRLSGEMVSALMAQYEELVSRLSAAGDEDALGTVSLGPTTAPAVPVAYPFEAVIGRIDARVLERPDAVAVTCEGEDADYRRLAGWSSQIGRRLHGLGVQADERVGLCVTRSVGMIAGLLGILRAGGAYVPLDAAYPRERLALMIGDSGIRRVVADARTVSELGDLFEGLEVVPIEDVAGEDDTPFALPVHPD